MSNTLSRPPHDLPVVVLSIDDLYLSHEQQEALAKAHPENSLVQHRGVPSTHDIGIGKELFDAIISRKTNIKVPSYDKSQFDGAGDRRSEGDWEIVNATGQKPVEVVIFEGWCVGFRSLPDLEVERKWKAAKVEAEASGSEYQGRLGRVKLNDVMLINSKLRDYDALTNKFGAFVHM